jgi:hypothetical protein
MEYRQHATREGLWPGSDVGGPLIAELLASVEGAGEDASAEAEWREELRRRAERVLAGEGTRQDWDEARRTLGRKG